MRTKNAVEGPHICQKLMRPSREFPEPIHESLAELISLLTVCLRLRNRFASRSTYSAQDDIIYSLLTHRQKPFLLPTFLPNLPIADSSIRSTLSSSHAASPSVVFRDQLRHARRQSSPKIQADRSGTCWQIPRSRRFCALSFVVRCYCTCRCRAFPNDCLRYRPNTFFYRPPLHRHVILSEIAFAIARKQCSRRTPCLPKAHAAWQGVSRKTTDLQIPRRASLTAGGYAVLRLRSRFASRSTYSAQDDSSSKNQRGGFPPRIILRTGS